MDACCLRRVCVGFIGGKTPICPSDRVAGYKIWRGDRGSVYMNRRDALRLLATGVALQLAPGNLLAALREARALLATQTTVRPFDLHQHATVTAIAELIIPRTDTPGVTDVRVTEFIDLLVRAGD